MRSLPCRGGNLPSAGKRAVPVGPARSASLAKPSLLVTKALGEDALHGLYENAVSQGNAALGAMASQMPEPLKQAASSSREMLAGSEPHFGSRQVLKALEGLTQQPLATSQQLASSLSSQLLSGTPSLPAMPQDLAAAASVLPESVNAAAANLSSTAASLLSAASGTEPGKLDSHFGSQLVQRSGAVLSDWLGSLASGVGADGGSVPDAVSMLKELQQMASKLAALPTNVTGSSLALGSDSAEALGTILQQQKAAVVGAAAAAAASGASAVSSSLQQLAGGLSALQAAASQGIGGHSPAVLALVSLATIATVAVTAPSSKYEGYTSRMYADGNSSTLGHSYDAEVLSDYFAKRPLAVARRAAVVAAEAAGFGAALLLDLWTGRLQANEPQRARQLRGIIERLGPAYVKVAQAISTRVDLLTPEYFLQIQLLQDRVPPFPCEQARVAMAEAFGRQPEEVFEWLSDRPVAAASLGQVYRATLRPELGGGDVAIKVLRPGVLEQVALDLYLIRELAAAVNRSGAMNTDWVAVIDEWALRFFAEMDYSREARNAVELARDMSRLSGISIAKVVPDLSTQDVLTTEWVNGEKLSESQAEDVRTLCNTLLNAYLIQLLETGFLHADPHPGNLLRTPEGKICILDYGLMTYVTEDQRWALLEYIAHLSTEDWPALAHDLQVMGFIPPEVDPNEAGLVEPLGKIMSQLVGGGGAAKVNIDKVTDELNKLGERYPFKIPPFFALILRAFSVIEGIALKVDPDYAIVKECFPYLSRRLLEDDSERARRVLRDLLYGRKQHLDMERLTRLANGFGAFTTDGLQGAPALASVSSSATSQRLLPSTSSASSSALASSSSGAASSRAGAPSSAPAYAASTSFPAGAEAGAPMLDPIIKDALVVMLGRRGSYVQDLLVNEAVAAADALSSATLYALLQALLGSTPAALARSTVAALGPLRQVLLPMPTPLEVLSRLSPALAATPEDREALGVVRGILALLQGGAAASAGTATSVAGDASSVALQRAGQQLGGAARELAPLMPQLAPGLSYMTEAFTRAFVQRLLQRLTSAGLGFTPPGLGLGSGRAGSAGGAAPAFGFMAPSGGAGKADAPRAPGQASAKGQGARGSRRM